MKHLSIPGTLTRCTAIMGAAFLFCGTIIAQTSTPDLNLAYNPYPPGVLPSNINSELARVRLEVMNIENEAMAQWLALPPPTLTGQPPTLQGTGMRANQLLGKLMNFDVNMSPLKDRACASCHMPYAGFSGPIPSVNLTMVAYPGSYPYRAGKRTAQRYTYASNFPVLNYNTTQAAFFGGNFCDSRTTGYLLGSPDAEQAQHPPVDTQEQQFADTACVAYRLSQASYYSLFVTVWGPFSISWPANTATICATPGGASAFNGNTMPIELSPQDRATANNVFDHWGNSLDQFEASPDVSPFSSKFDEYLAFLAGVPGATNPMTANELAGYNLFKGQGNCNSCHLDGRGTALTSTETDNSAVASVTPLFTCFGSANLGLPLNASDAIYYQTTPDILGFVGNPYGFGYRDLGLGTFLRSGYGAAPNPNSNWTQYAPTSDGQMQTSSARNVAMVPPACGSTEAPGPYFQKEFFHNGYIKSLKQLVHFYNTRDVYKFPGVTTGHCPPGTVERVTCWPEPEVPNNIDMTVGRLGLTDAQEDLIVDFLETLTDGYTTPYPDINTYTGTCLTGGTAATQGNANIIPAPVPLPPCAAAICDVPPLPGPNPIP